MGFSFPHLPRIISEATSESPALGEQLLTENQQAIEDYLDGLNVHSAVFFESDALDDLVERNSTWTIPGPAGYYLATLTAQLGSGGGITTGDEIWLVIDGNAWRSGEAVGSASTMCVTGTLLLSPNVETEVDVYWTGTDGTQNVGVFGGAIKVT